MNEVSRIAKVDPQIIETWEKEFYFLHSGQTGSGHKIFRKKDLEIILRLKELLEKKGFTIAGAKRRIEEEFQIKGASLQNPDKLKKILITLREELSKISSVLDGEK